jgi:amino acid transporter
MSDKYGGEKKEFGVSAQAADVPPTYDGSDIERTPSGVVHDQTHRKLKARHLQLIGIGGTIGTGTSDDLHTIL